MASFATPQLAQAWSDRKIELKLERMQKYNDLLYERLTRRFTMTRAAIDKALHDRVAIATKPSDLAISIFTYDYTWTVQDLTDTYPMSYYAIVKHTDLCERLSLFFGGAYFVVRWCKVDDTRYRLMLHYYPDGVNEQQKLHMDRCARDHLGREQAFVRDIEWFEGYSHFQEGSAPRTPPRVTVAPPPPPELIRKKAYARDYVTLEEAARDLGEELLREAYACHCCYRHDTDSESE